MNYKKTLTNKILEYYVEQEVFSSSIDLYGFKLDILHELKDISTDIITKYEIHSTDHNIGMLNGFINFSCSVDEIKEYWLNCFENDLKFQTGRTKFEFIDFPPDYEQNSPTFAFIFRTETEEFGVNGVMCFRKVSKLNL